MKRLKYFIAVTGFIIIFLACKSSYPGLIPNTDGIKYPVYYDTIVRFNSKLLMQENLIYKLDSNYTMMGFDTVTTFSSQTYEEEIRIDTIQVPSRYLIYEDRFTVPYKTKVDTFTTFNMETYEEKVVIQEVFEPELKKFKKK